jgi:hypothetical protein
LSAVSVKNLKKKHLNGRYIELEGAEKLNITLQLLIIWWRHRKTRDSLIRVGERKKEEAVFPFVTITLFPYDPLKFCNHLSPIDVQQQQYINLGLRRRIRRARSDASPGPTEAQETWSPGQERVGSASDSGALEVLDAPDLPPSRWTACVRGLEDWPETEPGGELGTRCGEETEVGGKFESA